MKNKWKSYVYVPVLACILTIGGWYIYNQQMNKVSPSKEQIYNLDEYFEADVTRATEAQVVDEKNVVMEQSPQEVPEPEAEFILHMVNDYVVVYRNNNLHESYMTTGIEMKELPVETQNEIIDGKEIADEEALYFFWNLIPVDLESNV